MPTALPRRHPVERLAAGPGGFISSEGTNPVRQQSADASSLFRDGPLSYVDPFALVTVRPGCGSNGYWNPARRHMSPGPPSGPMTHQIGEPRGFGASLERIRYMLRCIVPTPLSTDNLFGSQLCRKPGGMTFITEEPPCPYAHEAAARDG